MMKPYLNNVSGKSTSDVTMFSGGLNTCHDREFIRDEQMPFMWNVGLYEAPTLATRSNRLSLGWNLSDTTNYATGKILAMLPVTNRRLYVIEEREDTDNHVYRYEIVNGMLEKNYVGSVVNSNKYSMCECRDADNRYIIIATDNKRYILTDITETAIEEAEDVHTGIVACHKNRLWIAEGTSLKFSKLREYSDFDASDGTAGEINVTNAHGNITAIIPYDGKLIIFCEYSWHVLYGGSPDAEVDQFSLIDMDDGIGCISDKAVTICNRRLYFMDSDSSIYQYNGSSLIKISEPYGSDNYASYGGIKGVHINPFRLGKICMSSFDSYLYISFTRGIEADALNDTLAVYDTNNRLWWLEDGEFEQLTKWETSAFSGRTDHLLGAKYNGDILILNRLQKTDTDIVFNAETRHFDEVQIEYSFETKTWMLGTIKQKKTLTNVWIQASAEGRIGVCDCWSTHDVDSWYNTLDRGYIVLGDIKKATFYDMGNPNVNRHEGGERQRFIVPRMYMQKVNSFTFRVEGKGYGAFYLLEKEWRIK